MSDPIGEEIFHSPQCRCGHKKNLHSGRDANGRCVNRSCGCGKYTPREQRPLEDRIGDALADAAAFDGVAEAELNVTPQQNAERRAAEARAELADGVLTGVVLVHDHTPDPEDPTTCLHACLACLAASEIRGE